MSHISIRKRALFALVFVLVFVLAPIALLEGGARVYIHAKYGVPGKTYGLWRDDERMGVRHRENAYNTNAETNDGGFRNREAIKNPKPAGALRIIAYGGSTTFCYNLGNDEAWPLQLQRRLRERGHADDQVLNAGAILWSLGHAMARAQTDIPELKPDCVLIYAGINEGNNAACLAAQGRPLADLTARGEYGAFATNLEQSSWWKRNLVLVKLVDYVIKPRLRKVPEPVAAAAIPPPDPTVLDNYLHVLEAFIGLCRRHGATPVFIVQAHGRNTPVNVHLTSFSRAGEKLAKRLGVIVVDADKVVQNHDGPPMDLFYHTGVHYSKLGAERLAELIADEVFADR